MTDTLVSHDAPEVEFAAVKASGFRLSKLETLFFQCVIDGLRDNGVTPPKGHSIPNDVRRVVDYDHVKLLMTARLPDPFDSTSEGRGRRSQQLKMALKRNRERLMDFKIIGASNPFIWYTEKPIRGFDLLPAWLPASEY